MIKTRYEYIKGDEILLTLFGGILLYILKGKSFGQHFSSDEIRSVISPLEYLLSTGFTSAILDGHLLNLDHFNRQSFGLSLILYPIGRIYDMSPYSLRFFFFIATLGVSLYTYKIGKLLYSKFLGLASCTLFLLSACIFEKIPSLDPAHCFLFFSLAFIYYRLQKEALFWLPLLFVVLLTLISEWAILLLIISLVVMVVKKDYSKDALLLTLIPVSSCFIFFLNGPSYYLNQFSQFDFRKIFSFMFFEEGRNWLLYPSIPLLIWEIKKRVSQGKRLSFEAMILCLMAFAFLFLGNFILFLPFFFFLTIYPLNSFSRLPAYLYFVVVCIRFSLGN